MHSSSLTAEDLFSVGIGPSSSHTVGPMLAALDFRARLQAEEDLQRIVVRLRGSLGATGRGHGTPNAIMAGLGGAHPETCDPELVAECWREEAPAEASVVDGRDPIPIAIEFAPFDAHPEHANAVEFVAISAGGRRCAVETYLSVGGGFIVREGEPAIDGASHPVPYPFDTFADLLEVCSSSGLTIADVVRANTRAGGRDPDAACDSIWRAMRSCIDRGRKADPGVLPGGLGVRRRAPRLAERVSGDRGWSAQVSRIQVDALAVNEENASGGRVVTAPTNGAAGIIPAVINHRVREHGEAAVRDMLLTATAIGAIVKSHASISGAQVGCQGEVGSACAMAAAALCAALGGSPDEVGRAAEIGLEHHLGLTCDPVGGLVQVPCIERNAIAAVTAVQAATLARSEPDHQPLVCLDTVITTMRRVGEDMMDKYKETSLGGLAISVTEC